MAPSGTVQLIADCLSGNAQAKAQFYIQFSGVVRRAIARRLFALKASSPLRQEIEDITHEVFERLFRDRCQMLARVRDFSCIHAWLVAVAANHTVDYIRKLNTRGYGYPTSRTEFCSTARQTVPSPVQSLEQLERTHRLAQCLATLTEQERLIVDLFYVQGLKYAQIGEILRLNVNTLSARLRRARLKLRRLVEEDIP